MVSAMQKSLIFALLLFVPAFILMSAPVLPLPWRGEASDGCFLARDATVPSRPSEVRLRHEEDSLVIEISAWTEEGRPLAAKGDASSPEKIFHGDAIELFLSPHRGNRATYYQFAVNPSNVLYMAQGQNPSWRPLKTVSSSVKISPGRWTAVFAIPFGAFGEEKISEGAEWGANFATSSGNWSGTGDLHSPFSFGVIAFGAKERPVSVSRLFRDGDNLVLSFLNPQKMKISAEVASQKAESSMESFTVSASVRLGDEIPHKALRLCPVKASSDGKPLLDFDLLLDAGDPAWLVLDSFFYKEGEAAISYRAKGFGVLAASVFSIKSREKVLSRENLPPAGKIDASGLGRGSYTLELSEGKRRVYAQFEIVKDFPPFAPKPGKVAIYPECKTVLSIDCGGKHTPVYPVIGDSLPSLLGISGILSCGFTRSPAPGLLFDETKKESVYGARPYLAGRKDESAIYRTGYEAQMAVILKDAAGNFSIHPQGPLFFKDVYSRLKSEFPDKLFSVQIDSQTDPGVFAQSCDVFECAFWGSSYASPMMAKLPGDISFLKEIAPGKPSVLWLGGSLPSGTARTAGELNAAIHLSVLRGLAGNVVHLGHGGIPKERTRPWSLLENIERSVNAWYPQWVRASAVEASPEGSGVEYALRKSKDGKFLLLAVNTKPQCLDFAICDPFTGEKRSFRLPGYGVFLDRDFGQGTKESP